MKKVLVLADNDWANSGSNYSAAINKYSNEFESYYVVAKEHVFGYKRQGLVLIKDGNIQDTHLHKLYELLNTVDILHYKGDEGLGNNFFGVPIPSTLPRVVTYCGSYYRANMKDYWERDKQFFKLVSYLSIDLFNPHIPEDLQVLLPVGIDCDSIIRQQYERDFIVIGHVPSSYKKKNTKDIIEIVKLVSGQFPKDYIRFNMPETIVPHSVAMQHHSLNDIYLDKLSGYGVGNGSVEAMSSGALAPQIDEFIYDKSIMCFTGRDDLIDKLVSVCSNKELLNTEKDRSYSYVKRHHDYKVVAEKLEDIYRRLLNDSE